mmetsp:Transcript_5599/g.11947  ORF Transcript_5599/g.11947 Transcript_5599/m.11947 type:complete len:130 (+) Transcript_5599:42-431(+)
MPTRPSPRVIRDENERLREQLDEVKQSCLLLNHKVEGSETILSKQKEVILDLRQQLQAQELRHTEELRALNDAHSQVLKNFVQKHSIQVQGLEKKLRSLQNIVATSIVQKEPEKESDLQAAQPAAAATQ